MWESELEMTIDYTILLSMVLAMFVFLWDTQGTLTQKVF